MQHDIEQLRNTSTPEEDASARAKRRRRRQRRVVGIILGGTFLGFLAIWFGSKPAVPTGPIRLERGADGELVANEGMPKASGLAVHAGKLQANNTFSSTSSESRSSPSFFTSRRLMFLNLSGHPLSERVGAELLEQIQSWKDVDQVDYLPKGFAPDSGMLAPDYIIALDLRSVDESGTPLARSLEATIRIEAGNTLSRSRSTMIDHLTPPIVQSRFEGEIRHRSTLQGIESPASRYKLASENIAEQIAERLRKKIDDLREKNGPLPELPDDFRPPYGKVPEFAFLDRLGAREVVSFHGFMNHNETLWSFKTDLPPDEILPPIAEELQALGWRKPNMSTKPENIIQLRTTKGPTVIQVYRHDDRHFGNVERSGKSRPDDKPTPSLYHVHYVDRMSGEEIKAAVANLLEEGGSLESILAFHRHLEKETARKVRDMLMAAEGKSAARWLQLAKLEDRFGTKEASLEALRTANLLRQVDPDASDLKSSIKSLAKRLGHEKLIDERPTSEEVAKLGLIELDPERTYGPIPFPEGETLRFFGVDTNGELTIVSWDIAPDGRIRVVESRDGGRSRSWATGVGSHMTRLKGRARVTFNVEDRDKDRPANLRVELKPTVAQKKVPKSVEAASTAEVP
ncbi:hypothetical protein Pan216_56020 [Planctomycetes bacterium Pan216]|uniref:Uncharacterized protein n=1 Tax=Kolteria novifilia TaxID=2527975 RepID=A0A518BCJ9_9BACT|nr:hypothetical protein Pan216_56020 [Planctomycetes bacterium Pan216]